MSTYNTVKPGATRNIQTGWYHADQYGASPTASASVNTAAFQAAINAANTAGKGLVYVPDGTYALNLLTLKANVSIRGESRKGTVLQLASGAGTSLIVSDQFSANTGGATGSAWGGSTPPPSYFTIETLTIDGQAANQPAAAASTDYSQQNALLKLWGYHMVLRDLELINAKEIALYTEHYGAWENTFNQYQFAESVFTNIYAKNYWQVGWVNRGPHDSRVDNVYLSSYTASGAAASYGYVQQTSGSAYSASGAVVQNLHVWGQHSQNAVYLGNSNIIDGWMYAEGCTNAAVYLNNSSANRFKVFYGYASHGVELAGSSSDNVIAAVLESNGTGAVFKLDAANVGNRLTHDPGYSTPGGAPFDVSSGSYAGNHNLFVPSPAFTGTQTAGTLAGTDSVGSSAGIDASSAQTLSNKTLVSPKVNNVVDANGQPVVQFNATSSPVNWMRFDSAPSGYAPTIVGQGTDANVGINVYTKGTGQATVNSVQIATVSDPQTLTNKTLYNPVVNSPAPGTSGATGTAGMVAVDANYIYICTAANTWKRVALSAF